MLIEKSYLDSATLESIEIWLIESEMMSLSVKISRLLCEGESHERPRFPSHILAFQYLFNDFCT